MSKVLIAEDEPALLECFSDVVTSLGHECLGATNGKAAVEAVKRHQPDLVLLDYMMPGMNGGEVMRAIRAADPKTSPVFVLMSAADPNEADRLGAWRFLAKPISFPMLAATIAEALEMRELRVSKLEPAEESFVKKDTLNWLAHEIKSPLAAAMTSTELALRNIENNSGTPLGPRLSLTLRQLRRIDEIVTSILDSARLEDDKLHLHREEVDLSALAHAAIDAWRELYTNIDLQLHAPLPVLVEGDRERLRQVLDNLISNALKYGSAGRYVRVVIDEHDSRARMSVSDGGPGIPAAEMPRMFDRFHRITPQGLTRGHGLGLYITAMLVRLHGGTIKVESEPGNGARFVVLLPKI